MNKRISDGLNFDLNGDYVPAENYQLMNYGIGKVQNDQEKTLI